MSLFWQWDGNRSDNETRSEYRAVLEIEAWVFSSAQRPALKTNGAGESFPTSDLCSSESDFGLGGKRRRPSELFGASVRDSCPPSSGRACWRGDNCVFNFQNRSLEPLHKMPP